MRGVLNSTSFGNDLIDLATREKEYGTVLNFFSEDLNSKYKFTPPTGTGSCLKLQIGAAVTVQLMVVAATTGNDLTIVRVMATGV